MENLTEKSSRGSLLQINLSDNRILFVFSIITTFFWGLIAHSYGFLHSSFSHDSLNAFYADSVEISAKIGVGRFMVPVYEYLTRGFTTLPWVIGLLGLFYISVCVFFIVKMLDIKKPFALFLVAGIMTANITIIAQTATYIHELDCNMFASMLSVIAAYLWHKDCTFKNLAIGCILLFIAVSIYQSYLSVTLTLIMISVLLSLLNNEDIKPTIIKALKGIAMIAVSSVAYYIISIILCSISNIPLENRTNILSFEGITGFSKFIIWLVLKTYYSFVTTVADIFVYDLKTIIILAALILAITLLIILYTFKHDKELRLSNKWFIIALCGIFPLGINSTCIIARGFVHDVMCYSFWLIYVLFLVLVYRFDGEENNTFKYKKYIKPISCILIIIFLWQNVLVANTAYMKKDLEASATLSLMTRVVYQMEEHEEYIAGETPVAFIGVSDMYTSVEGFDNVKNIIGLLGKDAVFLDHSTSTYNAYRAYFKYILKYPIKMCEDSVHDILAKAVEVESLPAFPDKNCMKMIDGVFVVKMQ